MSIVLFPTNKNIVRLLVVLYGCVWGSAPNDDQRDDDWQRVDTCWQYIMLFSIHEV